MTIHEALHVEEVHLCSRRHGSMSTRHGLIWPRFGVNLRGNEPWWKRIQRLFGGAAADVRVISGGSCGKKTRKGLQRIVWATQGDLFYIHNWYILLHLPKIIHHSLKFIPPYRSPSLFGDPYFCPMWCKDALVTCRDALVACFSESTKWSGVVEMQVGQY
jgi:hypothetical protein